MKPSTFQFHGQQKLNKTTFFQCKNRQAKKKKDKKDNLKDRVGVLGRAERGGRTRSLKIKSLTLYRLS